MVSSVDSFTLRNKWQLVVTATHAEVFMLALKIKIKCKFRLLNDYCLISRKIVASDDKNITTCYIFKLNKRKTRSVNESTLTVAPHFFPHQGLSFQENVSRIFNLVVFNIQFQPFLWGWHRGIYSSLCNVCNILYIIKKLN